MKLDHPEVLAKAVAQYFHDKEITNYIGEVYSVTVGDGSEKFEIVVTTQRVDAKSPHDLRLDAETKLEYATQLLRDIEARLQSGDADFPSLGYDIECRMHEVLHDKP